MVGNDISVKEVDKIFIGYSYKGYTFLLLP